jgi:hydroxyquinol 1,2-dioxygenase
MIERTHDSASAPDDRFCEIMTSLAPHAHAFVASSPRTRDDDLDLRGRCGSGEPCLITGRVVDAAGDPVAGAHVDIWQADADGCYDVRGPGDVPSTAGSDGRFWFRAIAPKAGDGPVEWLPNATGRPADRAAHIRVKVSSPGTRTLTTRLHVTESPFGAVVGVRAGLIREFTTVYDLAGSLKYGLPNPFLWVHLPITVRRGASDD